MLSDPKPTGGYHTFDHTADVGLEAWGATLEQALAEVGFGFQSIMLGDGLVRPMQSRTFSVWAADEEALVVAWLSDLIFAFETEGWLSATIEISVTSATSFLAFCRGEPLDETRHEVAVGVKAVSYHELLVQRDDSGVRLRVILDV